MYVVEQYWHAVARSFRQAHIPGNNGLEYLSAEKAAEIGRHLLRKSRPVVVHRQKNALDGQGRINGPAKAHERVEQFGYAFESQIFTLDWDKHRIAGCQGIQCQKIKRRRAIDQYIRIFIFEASNRFPKSIFPIFHSYQLDGRTDQVLVRRDQVQSLNFCVYGNSFDRFVQNQRLIESPPGGILRKS